MVEEVNVDFAAISGVDDLGTFIQPPIDGVPRLVENEKHPALIELATPTKRHLSMLSGWNCEVFGGVDIETCVSSGRPGGHLSVGVDQLDHHLR